MLFDEEIEVMLPRDNLLDPRWFLEYGIIVRVTSSGNVNFSNGEWTSSYELTSGIMVELQLLQARRWWITFNYLD